MITLSAEYPVEKMCVCFGVSSSGYYKYKKRKAALSLDPEGTYEARLDERIRLSFKNSRGTYGSPRVTIELNDQAGEERVSSSMVARRMRYLGLVARQPKKFKPTTESKHNQSISDNVLDRKFTADRPGQKWVSDITYVLVKGRWIYLTVILDIADRRVIGWHLSEQMTSDQTILPAWRKALANCPVQKGLIFHSDRGVQYTSLKFRHQLRKLNCIQSMSRKGDCWDNAVAESFFRTLKTEELDRHHFTSLEQLRGVLFRYIEGFYNTRRIHTSIGNMPPMKKFLQITSQILAA